MKLSILLLLLVIVGCEEKSKSKTTVSQRTEAEMTQPAVTSVAPHTHAQPTTAKELINKFPAGNKKKHRILSLKCTDVDRFGHERTVDYLTYGGNCDEREIEFVNIQFGRQKQGFEEILLIHEYGKDIYHQEKLQRRFRMPIQDGFEKLSSSPQNFLIQSVRGQLSQTVSIQENPDRTIMLSYDVVESEYVERKEVVLEPIE